MRDKKSRGAGTNTPTTQAYTGQKRETSFGLYDYNARWYDSAIGRFTQADTLVPNPASAKAFDRYAYVENNPVNASDPSGHCLDQYGRDNGQYPYGYFCSKDSELRYYTNLRTDSKVVVGDEQVDANELPEATNPNSPLYLRNNKVENGERLHPALGLTLNWFFERGESEVALNVMDSMTQDFIQGPVLAQQRKDWLDSWSQNSAPPVKWKTIHDYSSPGEVVQDLYQGVANDNWTFAFTGSFQTTFDYVGQTQDGGYIVDITVMNETGWQSATNLKLFYVIKNQEFDHQGYGGTLTQYYRWREVIYIQKPKTS